MANSLYTNPLYFDNTTGASVTGAKYIRAIMWVSDEGSGDDIAADDDFLVVDAASKPICGKRAEFEGDDFILNFGERPFHVNGITVSKLDGGVCYIYLA